MIIDSSAVIASIQREEGYDAIEDALVDASVLRIGAPTRVECGMVLYARYGGRGRSQLERFLQENEIETVTFTEAHAAVATEAFQRFGKGLHPAGLNFGDCMSYATAVVAREPLLCVGDDFPQTDLELVDLTG